MFFFFFVCNFFFPFLGCDLCLGLCEALNRLTKSEDLSQLQNREYLKFKIFISKLFVGAQGYMLICNYPICAQGHLYVYVMTCLVHSNYYIPR